VTVGLIGWAFRDLTLGELEDRLSSRPVAQQTGFVLGVLAIATAGAFLSAQAGWLGLIAYFILLMLIVG
jgi:hypothetical protein